MTTIYQEINLHINRRIDDIKDSLVLGVANNFEEYREIVGRVHGLEEAMGIVKDYVTKTLEFEDDEDL